MEGTPLTVDIDEVKRVLLQIPGVKSIHDLHIWTVTSGIDSLTCHLVIDNDQDSQSILQQAIMRIEEQFSIHHTTLQIEAKDFQHANLIV
ncbi:Cadmium, cobalt and zinc/H(+)-K(+) antiporter [Sporomusa acidovorans DSM 3132]|uniref:Cadmium, cobalt and zinc/H(+)-K(+) antiporter n=2 Tax=Sporomusa TaxID=2375 RepID=A0ABZ3J2M7_SPOA4|nr:cadmium, cobalt and zinc/H(+)-K(+) antiporter [Sporomusa acidovorans DSM 3132]SDF75866.1 Cation efflux family [Sporomusa acidovorans]